MLGACGGILPQKIYLQILLMTKYIYLPHKRSVTSILVTPKNTHYFHFNQNLETVVKIDYVSTEYFPNLFICCLWFKNFLCEGHYITTAPRGCNSYGSGLQLGTTHTQRNTPRPPIANMCMVTEVNI